MKDSGYYYNTTEYKEGIEKVDEQIVEFDALASAEAEEKKKEVTKERNRLRRIFTVSRCGKENMHFVYSLIDRASWLRIEIEHVEKKLQEKGMTELFRQGLQVFVRENPLAKIHEKYIKNYQSVIQKLESYGGKESEPSGAVDDNNPIAGIINRGATARKKYQG